MMSFKKGSLILMVAIILLFSLASIALAAPPLQTPDDGSTVGDTIDLDNVKTNLGTVMSDKSGDDDADAPEGEEPEGDTPDGEEPEVDEPEGDDPVDEEGDMKEHPVASALAEYFGVEYDEVMDLHLAGNGFGNIVKAYFLIEKLDLEIDPATILGDAHGSGWGNVMMEYGLHPGNGKGVDKEKKVPPGQAKKNNDAVDELSGQSDGNGNNGNGNKGGNGNGKDKGKGKGKNK